MRQKGKHPTEIAVMLFYQVGEWFQGHAVGKSRRNISDLMDIRPDYANVERDGKLEHVDPDEVEIGNVIVVQPGETVSKILDLVENASSRKSKSEDFISKFAKIYTPVVCFSALALAIVPPLVRMMAMGLSADWRTWIYRALTFLVISCPCALVISILLSFFAGIGGASREGVLVKGSNYLEILSQTKIVVFDNFYWYHHPSKLK